MYQHTEDFVDLDFEQKVRQTAYHLWENDGRPEGREKEFWFLALEQELRARDDEYVGQVTQEYPPAANDHSRH